MIMRFIIVLLFVMFSTSAYADFNAGIAAYKEKDYVTALKEFRSLAEQGDEDAQTMLGYMYASGKGVLQDYIQAHLWFNLAAAQGNERAYKAREKISEVMTSQQVAEAQSLAREWKADMSSAKESAEKIETPDESEPVGAALIRETQENLAALGYEPGPADGVMGSKTRWAIRDYQEQAGLRIDGQPSQALLEQLQKDKQSQVAEDRFTKSDSPSALGTSLGAMASPNEQTQEVIDRLEEIVQKGEEERRADSQFLAELHDLIRRYDWPWQDRVFQDDFQDGDFSRNPVWTVASGEFWVDSSNRLVNRFIPPETESQSSADVQEEDTGTRIIKGIFSEILKEREEKSSRPKGPEKAEIHSSASINNAFSMDIEVLVRSVGTEARIEIGPFQGRSRDMGYRLFVVGGSKPSLELARKTSRGSSIIEISETVETLSDGRSHFIQWQRHPDGNMIVAIDGNIKIRTKDQTFQREFEGISIINHSGEIAINSINIFGSS